MSNVKGSRSAKDRAVSVSASVAENNCAPTLTVIGPGVGVDSAVPSPLHQVSSQWLGSVAVQTYSSVHASFPLSTVAKLSARWTDWWNSGLASGTRWNHMPPEVRRL